MIKILVLIILLLCYYGSTYSRSDENQTLKKKLSLNNEPQFNVRHLNKPFKINKLNLVWSKAKQVNISYMFICMQFWLFRKIIMFFATEVFRTRIKVVTFRITDSRRRWTRNEGVQNKKFRQVWGNGIYREKKTLR